MMGKVVLWIFKKRNILFTCKIFINLYCIYIISPLLPPSNFFHVFCPTPSSNDLFFLNYCLTHTHTLTHFAYRSPLMLDALAVAHLYMCLGLTDWDWITYWGLIPGTDWFSLPQESLITYGLHLGAGPWAISPTHTGSQLVSLFWSCSKLHECSFSVICRRHCLETDVLALWLF